MGIPLRYTTADLEGLPTLDGVRYEIIDGELYVSKQPHWHHQHASGRLYRFLEDWNDQTGAGQAIEAPGIIFAADDNVAPDVAWISRARLPYIVDPAGHLRGAPELVVEVLSPGAQNESRDRAVKLKLYSRQGVREYWIIDWQLRTVQVYRREALALELAATLSGDDLLESPLLPGFSSPVALLWPPPY
jgi:Uma2 family endonuclease